MDALIDDRAVLDDEEDESFDEETGDVKTKSNGANGRFDDSSEEDDDDEDEEAAAEVSVPAPLQFSDLNPVTGSQRLHC